MTICGISIGAVAAALAVLKMKKRERETFKGLKYQRDLLVDIHLINAFLFELWSFEICIEERKKWNKNKDLKPYAAAAATAVILTLKSDGVQEVKAIPEWSSKRLKAFLFMIAAIEWCNCAMF